jgi:hypothetical protein
LIKQYSKRALSIYYGFLCKLRKPYEYIHLLSHPRSGSTLLSHLLISHPEITGFGESKLIYSFSNDLEKLPVQVALKLKKFPFLGNERYAFDKLVHNWLIASENMANIYKRHTCVIFLLRDPKATLDSMSRLHWILQKIEPKEYVIKWYIKRIKTIKSYSQQLNDSGCERLIVLTYEQLLNKTKRVFEMLESVLQLQHPLSDKYRLFRTTGYWGHGDSSKFIRSGKIIRNRGKKPPPLLDFNDQMDMINQLYQDCYRELTDNCRSIASSFPIID